MFDVGSDLRELAALGVAGRRRVAPVLRSLFLALAGWSVICLSLGALPSRGQVPRLGAGLVPGRGSRVVDVEPEVWQAVAQGMATFLVQVGPDWLAPGTDWELSTPMDSASWAGSAGSLASLLNDLRSTGHVARSEAFPHAGWLALHGDEQAVWLLSQAPGVVAVRAVREHRLPPDMRLASTSRPPLAGWNLQATLVPQAWDRLGSAGEGTVVATIDTGVDWRHPALADQYRGRGGQHTYNWFDAIAGEAGYRAPADPHGHGTGVMGLILGRGEAATYGVAPRAQWIAVRAFDSQGVATDLSLLRAAEWLLAPTDERGRGPRQDLAPRVVNCSWVLENPTDPLFERIAAAWHRAGIVPVFAVGNSDEGVAAPGSALAPATYTSTVAVGASTPEGLPWPHSRIGPGWYGGNVPDVIAPGVAVRSTAPGGREQALDGTSMASAHVAGAVALLLSARPDLAVEDVRSLLCHTARDVAPAGPDPGSGCGLLDADAAAGAALAAGGLTGQVFDALGQPLASCRLLARPAGSLAGSPWVARSDMAGRYAISLPGGMWSVTLEPTGLAPRQRVVHVVPRQTTRLDWDLSLVGQAAVVGQLVSADGGPVAHGQVQAEDWPGLAQAAADGGYRLELPAGRHVLVYSASGYRGLTRTLELTAGLEVRQDALLWPVARLLVVDADAWRQERVYRYVTQVLDQLGYPHEVTAVEAVKNWEPRQLDGYDIVIWLQPYTSPGELNRRRADAEVTRALAQFVAAGGRLLLSGQEVGRLDASSGRDSPEAGFYRQVLGARRIGPAWGAQSALGVGLLEGLRLELAHPLGHPKANGVLADMIEPALPDGQATAVLRYPDGGIAGLAVDDGSGRRLFLAFGLESAGDRLALAQVLDAALAWLEPAHLRLAADSDSLAYGEAGTLRLHVTGGRSPMSGEIRVAAAPGLAIGAEGPLAPTEGGLYWQATLAPRQRLALRLPVRLAGCVPGGSALPVTATLVAGGRAQTTTFQLKAVTPDLGPSRLHVSPARLDRGGLVTVTLSIANGGLADATAAAASIGLPSGMQPLTESLACSAGLAWWQLTEHRVEWRGAVAVGETATLQFRGLYGPGLGRQHALHAVLEDPQAGRVERWASVLVGGPRLVANALQPSWATVEAGSVMTLGLGIANVGLLPARARATLPVPAGFGAISGGGVVFDPLGRTLTWQGEVAEGSRKSVTFNLQPTMAARGDHELLAHVQDGYAPEAPLGAVWHRRVRAPDLTASQLVLLPPRLVSGGLVSANLVLRNRGDVPAPVRVRIPMLPAVVALPDTVRSSGGATTVEAGYLDWTVTVGRAESDYGWRVFDAPGTPDTEGSAVPAGFADLGFAFPFGSGVYTQTYLSPAGLLEFVPPGQKVAVNQGTAEVQLPAVAAHYLPSSSRPLRIGRAEGLLAVLWGEDSSAVKAIIRRDGRIAVEWGDAVVQDGVTVGLRHESGAWTTIPSGSWGPGRRVEFDPPDGIAWLVFDARLGHGRPLNSTLTQTALVTAAGETKRLQAETVVDRATLAASRLTALPEGPIPGARTSGQLEINASGDATIRDVEVRIDLPEGLELLPSSLPPGVTVDALRKALLWRGNLAPRASRVITWEGIVSSQLPPGARLTTRASLRATGLPALERTVLQTVQASDFSGSAKIAWRSVAEPGEIVSFSLRVANAGPLPVEVRLSDALPYGLEFVPGRLLTSVSPAPLWDERSRSLSWQGTVPARSAIELEVGTRFRASAVVTNVMRIEDHAGTAFSAWAEVRPLRSRVYLPRVVFVAPRP